MSYYAPFMQPINYYNPNIPNIQNGMQGQNYTPQVQPQNSSLPITTSSLPGNNDNSMIWVLGKNEAESYPVAPNCQVVLWDKNAATIYVKSMSANGIPSMRTLDFTERTETAQNSPVNNTNDLSNKFVGIDEFNALRSEFDELRAKYNELEHTRNIQTEEKMKSAVKKSKGGDE